MKAGEERGARKGREMEVIDGRTLRRVDMETIVESEKKSGRVVVVEEAWRTGGFGAEIASAVQEEAFDYLDGPVIRVGGTEVPTPSAKHLESMVFPSPDSVV